MLLGWVKLTITCSPNTVITTLIGTRHTIELNGQNALIATTAANICHMMAKAHAHDALIHARGIRGLSYVEYRSYAPTRPIGAPSRVHHKKLL